MNIFFLNILVDKNIIKKGHMEAWKKHPNSIKESALMGEKEK